VSDHRIVEAIEAADWLTDVATAGGSSGGPPMPEPFDRDAVTKVLEWFDQEKDYLCARCANWTTYCDYCKARSRLRAKARQRALKALKQLQRREAPGE
jgi:hypothetical protein